MRKLFFCLAIPALLALPIRATAGELKLSINSGLVTLSAQNVPLSMIMAEWSRIGQTQIVNGDRILTPVTLELVNVPERKALDLILRSASGYMLAERPAPVANASAFDRILILPTSTPPAYSPVTSAPPAFNAPRPFTNVPQPIPAQPVPDMDDVGEEEPPNGMPPGVGPQGAPGQLQTAPGQPQLPGSAPMTAPRPGQLPQPAPQQPVPFGAPPRPPGTGPGGAPAGGPGGGPGGEPGGGGSGGA